MTPSVSLWRGGTQRTAFLAAATCKSARRLVVGTRDGVRIVRRIVRRIAKTLAAQGARRFRLGPLGPIAPLLGNGHCRAAKGRRRKNRTAQDPMVYRFYTPPPPLSAFVASFWLYQSDPSEPSDPSDPQAPSRILPSGTAQLVIDLSGDGLCLPGPVPTGRSRGAFPAVLRGVDSTSFLLENDRPLFEFGVDFTPGGAYPFFAPSASALQNRKAPLDGLWGARLAGTDIRGAFLTGAYLSFINFYGANLHATRLKGSDLRDGDLCDSN